MQRQEEVVMATASIAAKIAVKRAWTTLCALGLVMGLAACEKLDEPPGAPDSMQAIPSGYGEFVGATPHGLKPWVTVLWFEKPDKTIVGMAANLPNKWIAREPILMVPRN
jgi:hypothetical protein